MLPGPHCPHCTCNYASTVSTEWAKYFYSVQTGYLLKIPTYEHRPVQSLLPTQPLVPFPYSLALVPSALLSCNYDVVAISSMSAIAASPSRSLTLTLHKSVSVCVCDAAPPLCLRGKLCAPPVVHIWKVHHWQQTGRRRGRRGKSAPMEEPSLTAWKTLLVFY